MKTMALIFGLWFLAAASYLVGFLTCALASRPKTINLGGRNENP